MAFRFVTAKPKEERLKELEKELARDAFAELRPFGRTLNGSLKRARRREDGRAVWEEEDYCRPPLKEEREAVLDKYFDEIETEDVAEGEGWERIRGLPRLFPGLES